VAHGLVIGIDAVLLDIVLPEMPELVHSVASLQRARHSSFDLDPHSVAQPHETSGMRHVDDADDDLSIDARLK
jgi:hypothetical protein